MPPLDDRREGRGSLPIGDLASKVASSAMRSASAAQNLTEQLNPNSGTSGSRSPARRAANSTGTQLSTTGSVSLPVAVTNELRGAEAWRTDKALLAALPQPVARRLVSKPDYSGNNFEVAGYELRPGASPEDLRNALALVEESCRPAPGAIVVQELAKVMAVTKAREHDGEDEELSYTAMADGLIDFPIDVIRDACRAYAKCHKWRPSLSELREFCWPRFRARESLRAALRRA